VTCFTDTMFSNSKSRQGNKAAQVFCTANGWTIDFPMAKEKDTHEALSLLFHRDGFPNVMVMDGANAHIQGDFQRKLREAGCHIKQTEPHTPKSNAAEGSIRELKRGVGREMVRSGAPNRLWHDCLVREAYVRSSTALDIFSLE
jgi:transposase-like protein